MTTEKQIEANRENTKKSTGPKSREGKLIVSNNALKHGIFSKELIIEKGDGKEDRSEFDLLLLDLSRDLQPNGKLEELLVEKIAVNYWRLRRLIRFEAGQIRDRLDDYRASAISNYYDMDDDFYYSSRNRTKKPAMKYFSYNDQISEEEFNSQKKRLQDLENEDLELSEDEDFLKYVLETKFNFKSNNVNRSDKNKVKKYLSELSPQLFGRIKWAYFEIKKQKVEEMGEVIRWQKKFEILELMKNMPKDVEVEKIIKYENSLERSIFRNLSVLKELQKRRN